MKRSRQREAIISELNSRRDHPTAEEIYLSLKNTMPNISLGTVYRNLNLLSSEGIIGKLFVGGADRFDYNAKTHYHLLCTKCNRLFDVDMPVDDELEKQASNYVNGVISSHSLTFIGECENCSH
ncbi:MAG: transcriptional repressor [Clostridia bacterium]|nr:transcriptional repressor [Clostridia bacterium]